LYLEREVFHPSAKGNWPKKIKLQFLVIKKIKIFPGAGLFSLFQHLDGACNKIKKFTIKLEKPWGRGLEIYSASWTNEYDLEVLFRDIVFFVFYQ